MGWKQVVITVFLVMFGIYLLKWINGQWKIPVVGTVIETV